MKTRGLCPSCEGVLTIWDAIKSPSPLFLQCPRCRAVLQVRMPLFWPFVAGVGLLFLALGFATAWELGALRFAAALGFFSAMVGSLVFAEIGTALLYYNCAHFQPANPISKR